MLSGEASPLILLRRIAAVDRHGVLDDKSELALLQWAEKSRLGQSPELIQRVAQRRTRALAELRALGHTVIRLRAEPEWRLAVGLGATGPTRTRSGCPCTAPTAGPSSPAHP